MIIESVWKNIIVSDESLTRCIYSLRCIFEKIGYDRCIETIYRKGYRFSGQVFKTKINEDNTSDYSIAIFPFTTSLNTLDPLILNQELVQIISNKKSMVSIPIRWLRQIFVMITYLKIHS
ncbi:transcriptional regulator [Escherichia coli]|nr:transcriptional regulator [Escherichia coli]